jgi:hypothetical protein
LAPCVEAAKQGLHLRLVDGVDDAVITLLSFDPYFTVIEVSTMTFCQPIKKT